MWRNCSPAFHSNGMRFTPVNIEVKQGEGVRFVVKNAGKLMHQLVIGTRKEPLPGRPGREDQGLGAMKIKVSLLKATT